MVIALLLASIWLWDSCDPTTVAWRVHTVYLRQIASVPDMDDDGNLYASPIYSPWAEVMLYQGSEMTVDDMCQPERGAVCVVKVESVDAADNPDKGEDCP